MSASPGLLDSPLPEEYTGEYAVLDLAALIRLGHGRLLEAGIMTNCCSCDALRDSRGSGQEVRILPDQRIVVMAFCGECMKGVAGASPAHAREQLTVHAPRSGVVIARSGLHSAIRDLLREYAAHVRRTDPAQVPFVVRAPFFLMAAGNPGILTRNSIAQLFALQCDLAMLVKHEHSSFTFELVPFPWRDSDPPALSGEAARGAMDTANRLADGTATVLTPGGFVFSGNKWKASTA